jgi:hypothetical protein
MLPQGFHHLAVDAGHGRRTEIDGNPVGLLVLQDGSDPFFSGHGFFHFILTKIIFFRLTCKPPG